jgi:hypothetical protein
LAAEVDGVPPAPPREKCEERAKEHAWLLGGSPRQQQLPETFGSQFGAPRGAGAKQQFTFSDDGEPR